MSVRYSPKNSFERSLAETAGIAAVLGGLLFRHSRMKRALKERERGLRDLVDQAADAFFIHDSNGKMVDCNRAACESLGYTREELLSLSVGDIEEGFLPQQLEGLWSEMEERVPLEIEGVHRRKDGSTFPVEIRVGLLERTGRKLMFALVRDMTRRKENEEALRESEERFRQLFENSADAFFIHDRRGRILDCNEEASRALGYTREELLSGTVADITVRMLSEEERNARKGEALWDRVMRDEPGHVVGFDQNELRRKDGSTFPVEVGVGSIQYKGERSIFATARDITARRELEKKLRHEALHDPLTKLPNRALFADRVGHALVRANRKGGSLAILFIDLDDFKSVNDNLGHEAGDQLLISFSRRLRDSVRDADTVSRLAGDEFTILLEHLAEEDEAILVVERILKNLETPFRIKGREIPISASIGVSYSDSSTNPGELLNRADEAMYLAKENGKAGYEVYRPTPQNKAGTQE
jgi:diguanylate cyclase (GGDEF)-like protein/PAS domain S-box-containing protein